MDNGQRPNVAAAWGAEGFLDVRGREENSADWAPFGWDGMVRGHMREAELFRDRTQM